MKKLIRDFAIFAVALIALVGIASTFVPPARPAYAQASPSLVLNWAPSGIFSLSVTGTSANVHLTKTGTSVLICNQGSADVYLAFGTANTLTATTSGNWLKSSKCQVYSLQPFGVLFTYIAAITASSSATLYIETGVGTPLPLE